MATSLYIIFHHTLLYSYGMEKEVAKTHRDHPRDATEICGAKKAGVGIDKL